jgi:hypothetical protein
VAGVYGVPSVGAVFDAAIRLLKGLDIGVALIRGWVRSKVNMIQSCRGATGSSQMACYCPSSMRVGKSSGQTFQTGRASPRYQARIRFPSTRVLSIW